MERMTSSAKLHCALDYVQTAKQDLKSFCDRILRDQACSDHLVSQCRRTIVESRELISKVGETAEVRSSSAADDGSQRPRQ